jgi:hypothetical protein
MKRGKEKRGNMNKQVEEILRGKLMPKCKITAEGVKIKSGR